MAQRLGRRNVSFLPELRILLILRGCEVAPADVDGPSDPDTVEEAALIIGIRLIVVALMSGCFAVATGPAAHADASVMYEVISSYIPVATIEYSDVYGQHTLDNVALPWRMNVTVADAHSADTVLRADWKSEAGRYKWATVRIYAHGSLLCENTLDAGNASCDGRGAYADQVPRW